MDSKIISYLSRFVIPFYYEYENNGYENIRSYLSNNEIDYKEKGLTSDKGEWIETGFWENYNSSEDKEPERELFSFLHDIFQADIKNPESARNLGLSFVYKVESNRVLGGLEFKDGKSQINFKISDLGVLLLKNGIGFVWYQIEILNKIINTSTYISFLKEFKELAREKNGKVSRKERNHDTEQKDVSLFSMGNWIREILSAEELGIMFWTEKASTIKGEKKCLVPDKALLFQYLFVDKNDEVSIADIAFRSATGFDWKYCTPEDIDSDIYRPFGNTCFYISKSGMSYVVLNNDTTNEGYFKNDFRSKYKLDYFFIYLLLLFQSYSCVHYSRLLTKLPADGKAFESGNVYMDKLESLNGQINLFMVKSVFDSVSNMHHQDELYRYGKSRLYIDEDIQSLTVGLDALRDIERDKRESEVNRAIIIFGFIVVVSAWIDGVNLVDWFLGKLGYSFIPLNIGHGIISVIIIGLTVYLFRVLWKNRK